MKTAILQVADTGPLESLVMMLDAAGYECRLPSASLKHELRSIGCDTVLNVDDLIRGMGYSNPMPLLVAHERDVLKADLFVDIKAHRNGPRIWARWPNLIGKTLWYRINGGKPEHVIRKCEFCRNGQTMGRCLCEDCGDEVNPPCPVLTPNLWYRRGGEYDVLAEDVYDRSYACWPPFYRFDKYHPQARTHAGEPLCLIHNLVGWGYGALVDSMMGLGVRMYGAGSPDGLISHEQAQRELKTCLAYVHLKSSDAPGYALYEALASGCPVICTRRLIWRNRMQDLLIPGETCLVFDRETHDGLTTDDIRSCLDEVACHLDHLKDPAENQRIGMNGYNRLRDVQWKDTEGFMEFMRRQFP